MIPTRLFASRWVDTSQDAATDYGSLTSPPRPFRVSGSPSATDILSWQKPRFFYSSSPERAKLLSRLFLVRALLLCHTDRVLC